MHLPEGSTGDGPDPFPGWDLQSCWCCRLRDEARCGFPSPGFPGEILGLSPPGAELGCSRRSDPGGGAG